MAIPSESRFGIKDYNTSAFKEDWNPVMGETKPLIIIIINCVILAPAFIAARDSHYFQVV